MPTFSLNWITVPVGFLFLAYITWQSYLQRNEARAFEKNRNEKDALPIPNPLNEKVHQLGRLKFREVVAAVRGKLDLIANSDNLHIEHLGTFANESAKELSSPVQVVIEHIADKKSLHDIWEKYRAFKGDSDGQAVFNLTCERAERGLPRENQNREIANFLFDYLEQFKKQAPDIYES